MVLETNHRRLPVKRFKSSLQSRRSTSQTTQDDQERYTISMTMTLITLEIYRPKQKRFLGITFSSGMSEVLMDSFSSSSRHGIYWAIEPASAFYGTQEVHNSERKSNYVFRFYSRWSEDAKAPRVQQDRQQRFLRELSGQSIPCRNRAAWPLRMITLALTIG